MALRSSQGARVRPLRHRGLGVGLLVGFCLWSPRSVPAEEPSDGTAAPLLSQPPAAVPVYVWPIMRGCAVDQLATEVLINRLSEENQRFKIHKLAIAKDPGPLSCTGDECKRFLQGPHCPQLTGILIGGELEQAPCDPSDPRYFDCKSAKLVSRIRLFQVGLEPGAVPSYAHLFHVGAAGALEQATTQEVYQVLAREADRMLSAAGRLQTAQPWAAPLSAESCAPGTDPYTRSAAPQSPLSLGCIPYKLPRCAPEELAAASPSWLPAGADAARAELAPQRRSFLSSPLGVAAETSVYVATIGAYVAAAVLTSKYNEESTLVRNDPDTNAEAARVKLLGVNRSAMWTAWVFSAGLTIPSALLLNARAQGGRRAARAARPSTPAEGTSCAVTVID